MATRREREGDAKYEQQTDPQVADDMPDNSWAMGGRGAQGNVPVQKDTDPVEDPIQPASQMKPRDIAARDEDEVADPSNIIRGERTRHAKPTAETGYSEGPDEEDMES